MCKRQPVWGTSESVGHCRLINNVLYELSDALTLILHFKVKTWALCQQT